MITTAFNGPIGSGIRPSVVVPLARAQRGRITVVSPLREILKQWEKLLPEAERLTMLQWQKRADDPAGTLVIVDGMHPAQFSRYVATLSSIEAHVWLVQLEQWEMPAHVRQVFSRMPPINRAPAPLVLDHDPKFVVVDNDWPLRPAGQEGGAPC